MTEELPPDQDWDHDDPLDISYMDEVRQRHIVGLGMIAEFTSQLDEIARWLLGMAVGVDNDQAVALFMGDRFSSLRDRYKALNASSENEAVQEAIAWFVRTAGLVERRDRIMHRPVSAHFEQGRSRHLLRPARRNQQVEELTDQAMQLVVELGNAFDQGYDVAVRLYRPPPEDRRVAPEA